MGSLVIVGATPSFTDSTFRDYQAFDSRPQEIVDSVFGESKNWAIVTADLSQFYDRVRPELLHRKIENMLGPIADPELMKRFRAFFRWSWHLSDQKEARKYAETAEPQILLILINSHCLRAWLRAVFLTPFLVDLDEALCNDFGKWNDDNQWQLVDFCRYVDDMRIVIRLRDDSIHMKEEGDHEVRFRLPHSAARDACRVLAEPKEVLGASGAGCCCREHSRFSDDEANQSQYIGSD